MHQAPALLIRRVLTTVLSLAAGLVAIVAGAGSSAAQPSIRLSWDDCDPIVVNRNFTGPGLYRMTFSGTNFGGAYQGYQLETRVRTEDGSSYPDAWRFDLNAGGCQGPSRMLFSPIGANPNCPPLQGSAPLTLAEMRYEYPIDPPNTARLILFNVYDTFQGDAQTRYHLYQLDFDHALSTAGPSVPGATCGGAEVAMCFQFVYGNYLDQNGVAHEDYVVENGFLTWNLPTGLGRCPGATPAVAQTWGALKGQYR
jgi:hypothetical protein